jgi:signal transduction histidine kinase
LKLIFPLPSRNIILVTAIAGVAAILSIVSYQYYTYNENQILKIASDDVRSNAAIQSHGLSRIVELEIDKVTAILKTLATAPAIHNEEIQRGRDIINLRQEATSDITDAYFWLDNEGRLIWSSKFANNQSLYEQFKDINLGDQSYFTIPRSTQTTYYSSVIESLEGVPKIYISMPIIGDGAAVVNNNNSNNNETAAAFRGVIVAGIRTDILGNFVKAQIPPGFESNVGLLDKNSIILYTTNQTYIGKDYFGKEFQSTLSVLLSPKELEDLNNIVQRSLQGNAGIEDTTVTGQTTSIAYTPVMINGEDLLTLYITSPHKLTSSVSFLVDQQEIFNIIMIVVIAAVAAGFAFLILLSNKRLTETVKLRTSELKIANESLAESNEKLQASNALLSQANEQLQAHDKMQREFINIAAHELRTPTQAILGYSELFFMSSDDHASKEEAMRAISRNAQRLQRLTNDILDVTRIEGKKLELNKEKFNIHDVIKAVIADAKRQQVQNADIEFVYEPKDNNIIVCADKERITQVVSNLIINAVKFTKKGKIFVTTEEKESNNEVVITVKDTGTGIADDIMPRLFTKFATKSDKGTGLGLYISKAIVEAHGGKIWAENNKDGRGAKFTIILPAAID